MNAVERDVEFTVKGLRVQPNTRDSVNLVDGYGRKVGQVYRVGPNEPHEVAEALLATLTESPEPKRRTQRRKIAANAEH